jgi:hypothetical protein
MKSLKLILITGLILTAGLGKAQINYTDIWPDHEMSGNVSDTFEIDMNGDMDPDIGIATIFSYGPPPTNEYSVVILTPGFEVAADTGYTAMLDANEYVDSFPSWTGSKSTLLATYGSGSVGNWLYADDKFIGIRNTSGTDTTWGFVRVSLPGNNKIIVQDYAMSDAPGYHVWAGFGISYNVRRIEVTDVDNQLNGNDLKVSFEKALYENEVTGYRVMVVPVNQSTGFDLDSARYVPATAYKEVLPAGIDTNIIFGDITTDVYGQPVKDLIPYRVFVMTVFLIGLPQSEEYKLSVPSDTIELQSVCPVAQTIMAKDIDDNNNGSDAELCFVRATDESLISNYRLFVVKDAVSGSFNLQQAMMVSSGNYADFDSSALSPCLRLPAGMRDTDGDLVQNNVIYRAFILSVPDSQHTDFPAISAGSTRFVLATPNVFYADQMTGVQFTDVSPDTTITGMYYGPPVYFYMDMNDDGTDDFYFECYYGGGLGGGGGHVYLHPLNGNELMITQPGLNDVPVLDTYEQIFYGANWSSDYGRLCAYSWAMGLYYNSYGYWNGISNRYLGVRIFAQGDTLYGWILASVSGYYSVTTHSFALCLPQTGMEEESVENDLTLCPVPAGDFITISVEDCNEFSYVIYNINGQAVLAGTCNTNTGRAEISGLPAGVYSVSVNTGAGVQNKKFIRIGD